MVVAAFARSATRAWAICTSLLATGPLRRDANAGETQTPSSSCQTLFPPLSFAPPLSLSAPCSVAFLRLLRLPSLPRQDNPYSATDVQKEYSTILKQHIQVPAIRVKLEVAGVCRLFICKAPGSSLLQEQSARRLWVTLAHDEALSGLVSLNPQHLWASLPAEKNGFPLFSPRSVAGTVTDAFQLELELGVLQDTVRLSNLCSWTLWRQPGCTPHDPRGDRNTVSTQGALVR
jgi:hypothetical protein